MLSRAFLAWPEPWPELRLCFVFMGCRRHLTLLFRVETDTCASFASTPAILYSIILDLTSERGMVEQKAPPACSANKLRLVPHHIALSAQP